MSVTAELASHPFVAVVEPTTFTETPHLKRLLLLFDRLAVNLGEQRLGVVERRALELARRDIDWLTSEGLLTTVLAMEAERGGDAEDFRDRLKDARSSARAPLPGMPRGAVQGFRSALTLSGVDVAQAGPGHLLRRTAAHLRQADGLDAVAVAESAERLGIDQKADRDHVIRLTLNTLPFPSDSTPWEDVMQFKRDPDSRRKFFRLKNWINRMGKAELSGYEVVDQLNELLFEYQAHMESHRIQTTRGRIEVIVTTLGEVAEDLVKLKFGKLAKLPFDLARGRITLLQAEQGAPGKEVAYVIAARQKFSG
ncbi:MAG TPA: hypothetical protein VF746_11660 [Longimicrobium sp.]